MNPILIAVLLLGGIALLLGVGLGLAAHFMSVKENEKAKEAAVTPNCREQCSNCGAQRLNGGKCDALLKIDRGRDAV